MSGIEVMRRLKKLAGQVPLQVKRAAVWLVRKLRRTPDPRVIEELTAQQDAAARQIMDHLAELDTYRLALAGDDPEKRALLADIERQAVLTIQTKLTNDQSR